jgi:tetratricopeptide (TPR) repeat protein
MTGHLRVPPIATIALSVALAVALAPSVSKAQSAGSTNLLAAPGSWPTTGAASGFTALGLDPTAVYWNPAGLAMQDERTVLLQHGILPNAVDWDLAAVSYPLPGLGAVGMGIARVGTSGLDAYDANNVPLGTIGYTETALGASISRRLFGPLHAGATFKVVSQSLGDLSAAAPGIDLGAVYRPSRFRGAQIGVSVQNVVAGALDLGGASTPLARSFRLGVAGPEWRVSRRGALRAVADVAQEGSAGTKPRLGLEFTRPGLGAVRAGLQNGLPVLGLGVNYRRYGVDLTLLQGDEGASQQFAVRLGWGERASEYEGRRLAQYQRAAEESLRARTAVAFAADRARAEAAVARGAWDEALVVYELLHRARPDEPFWGAKAREAREAIAAEALRTADREAARRADEALTAAARDALVRGDVEEASGLVRALVAARGRRPGDAAPAESLAVLEAEVAALRTRLVARALVRADSLRAAGRALPAVEDAATALRLSPDDPRAQALWARLEEALGKSVLKAETLNRRLEGLGAVNEASRAFAEGRYADAARSIDRALSFDPQSAEAKAWRERIARRLAAPKAELDVRIKQLYIKGMEAFTAGDYQSALQQWEQILVFDPLNESARRNVLEARERMKAAAQR